MARVRAARAAARAAKRAYKSSKATRTASTASKAKKAPVKKVPARQKAPAGKRAVAKRPLSDKAKNDMRRQRANTRSAMKPKGPSDKAKKRALKKANEGTGVREFNAASARAAKRADRDGTRSRYSMFDGRRMGPTEPGQSTRSADFVKDAATARKLRLAKQRAAAATRRRRAKQGGATAGLSAAAVTARRRGNKGR